MQYQKVLQNSLIYYIEMGKKSILYGAYIDKSRKINVMLFLFIILNLKCTDFVKPPF